MSESTERWSVERAQRWQASQPWLVGANYLPAYAINQLEMWSAATYDPERIALELDWAQSLGFTSLRVFLHDLAWQEDPDGLLGRVDQVLELAAARGIGLMPVLFDSVWHPFPHTGTQPLPEPGVHNSGWVQGPGVAVLRDEARFAALEAYVTAMVRRFADDPRVQVWDLWNEPCNDNRNSYGTRDLGPQKAEIVLPLLARVFDWARAAAPSQPLTAGLWRGGWVSGEMSAMETLCRERSDVISFHAYHDGPTTQRWLDPLLADGRPVLCTEYMARPVGSTFQAVLPVFQAQRVGAYCWGFVAGKSQTNYPWDSWQNPYPNEPDPWFHDIFRADGTPYRPEETAFLKATLGSSRRP